MRKLKAFLTVIGAVTILVLATNTLAVAATGHAFILGKKNTANKVSTLKRTTSGPALKLKTSSSSAPLQVNGTGKVANLDADKVDGLDSTQLGVAAFAAFGGDGAISPRDGVDPVGGSAQALSQADETAHTIAGTYCFHPSFTPKSAMVSAVGDVGIASTYFTVATVTIRTNHNLSGCGPTDTVRVRTYVIPADPGSPALTDEPFILWLK